MSTILISSTAAHFLTFTFALVYVGSLYVSKDARLSFSRTAVSMRRGEARPKERDERWRNDPDVIKARLAAVSLASVLCGILVFTVVWLSIGRREKTFRGVLTTVLKFLGLNLSSSIYPHLLTPLLFIGPLYTLFLAESLPFQWRWTFRDNVLPSFTTWVGVRNHILAPITEEFVFRACVLSVYHLSGASRSRMIFLSPLSFGAAHVHHAWDTYNRYGRTLAAAKRAIIMSLFQFTYTTLFGFHCAFLFLRTGSLLPPVSAHIFCNLMGVPQIGMELKHFPQKKSAIICAYLVGIFAFVAKYGSWTRVISSVFWQN